MSKSVGFYSDIHKKNDNNTVTKQCKLASTRAQVYNGLNRLFLFPIFLPTDQDCIENKGISQCF